MLQKIRGVKTADKALQAELDDIQKAVTQAQREQTSILSGLSILCTRYPQILFAAVLIPIAQQFTGMNAIMFVRCPLYHSLMLQEIFPSRPP